MIAYLIWEEDNALFNDAMKTFYLRLYFVGHMIKDYSKRGNPLPPLYDLLFPTKGYFICNNQ